MSGKKETLYVLGRETGQIAVIRPLVKAAGMLVAQPQHGWGTDSTFGYIPDLVFTPEEVGLGPALYTSESAHEETRQFKVAYTGATVLIERVVFVECEPAAKAWGRIVVDVIDPNCFLRNRRPAILQVVDDLGITMSDTTRRWVELVATDVEGGIAGMLALGATKEEITRVRAFGRKACGVRPKDEWQVEKAIADKEEKGRVAIIHLNNNWADIVSDYLYDNGDIDQWLVFTKDGEAHFYGEGAICKGLFDARLAYPYPQFHGRDGFGVEGEKSHWAARAQDGDDLTEFKRVIRNFVLDHVTA